MPLTGEQVHTLDYIAATFGLNKASKRELYREMEARCSIANPSSPHNNVNSHRQGPIGYDYWQTNASPSRWTCSYCGGSRSTEFDNCPGCGAGRV